jgi:hypothetical protein
MLIDAVIEHGSMRAAAKALGRAFSGLQESIKGAKRRAAQHGYSPEHHLTRPVAPGYVAKGHSTLYRRGEPEPVLQWVKTTQDAEAREAIMREFVAHLIEDVRPCKPIKAPTAHAQDDLLAVYPLGDPHFGMRAWWEDAGENFDLAIAEQLTTSAVDRLVSVVPVAGTALFLNLGDMYHADNQKNQTQSGHQLDVDGRWKKVQRVGLATKIHCIRRLAEKHPRVIVRINGGNHDDHSSYGLAMMLDCYFKDNPRIEIDLSPSPVWYYKFGKVFIGSTHGDDIKGPDMLPIMATDKPKDWGDTVYRYWYVGHVHHQDLKEYRGGVVEYFRTLAARDAWHNGQGYRAGRDMRAIIHHREHGEVERHRCDIGMIEA